jgi:hypothetical protein
MRLRRLGRSSLEIPVIGIGSWVFGGTKWSWGGVRRMMRSPLRRSCGQLTWGSARSTMLRPTVSVTATRSSLVNFTATGWQQTWPSLKR